MSLDRIGRGSRPAGINEAIETQYKLSTVGNFIAYAGMGGKSVSC